MRLSLQVAGHKVIQDRQGSVTFVTMLVGEALHYSGDCLPMTLVEGLGDWRTFRSIATGWEVDPPWLTEQEDGQSLFYQMA